RTASAPRVRIVMNNPPLGCADDNGRRPVLQCGAVSRVRLWRLSLVARMEPQARSRASPTRYGAMRDSGGTAAPDYASLHPGYKVRADVQPTTSAACWLWPSLRPRAFIQS